VKTHPAPVSLLSVMPPTIAVLPSADGAADQPCSAGQTAPVPTSFDPGCESGWLAAATGHAITKNAASQYSSGPNRHHDRRTYRNIPMDEPTK
jgi:hypothetical protein